MLGFGFDKVKGLGNRNVLESTKFSRFWTSKKLKLNLLAKGLSSDSFTINCERIYNRHMNGFPNMTLSVIFLTRTNVVLKHVLS